MAKNNYIVTTEPDAVKKVASKLPGAGCEVKNVMEEIGSISISAPNESAVTAAKKIKGVVDVSPEGDVDIGPPGSSDTW